jgi:hypothetical protein
MNEGEGEKKRRTRTSVDWAANPFTVVVGGSTKVLGAYADVGAAVEAVKALPPGKQSKAFIGQFKPVKVQVKSEVTL